MTLGSFFTEVDDIVGQVGIVQRVEIAGDICCRNLNSFFRESWGGVMRSKNLASLELEEICRT